MADRLEKLQSGIDQAHESVVAFNTPARLAGALLGHILSGPSHANKLLAGYVALRALGIQANFVDILLVQTLVMFLLYFAPTPGASGVGEVLSAAVMSSYVPQGAHPDLHPDLAIDSELLHHRLRVCGLFRLGAERASRGVEDARARSASRGTGRDA